MKLALTLGVEPDATSQYDFLRHGYVPFLEQLGVIPILVPNVIADPCAYVEAVGAQGLVLSGGGDIDPDRYGQANTASLEISTRRDAVEFQLLTWAVERALPVLAICRGIQVINVFFGGQLVQDIPGQIGNGVQHDKSQHPVQIVDETLAHWIGAGCLTVNSHHHQAVTEDCRAPVLDVFALSEPDGVIEGLRHPSLPVLGVQWHPERPSPSREADLRLFRAFLQGEL
jgi:putative glutamine amidotransferase